MLPNGSRRPPRPPRVLPRPLGAPLTVPSTDRLAASSSRADTSLVPFSLIPDPLRERLGGLSPPDSIGFIGFSFLSDLLWSVRLWL